MSERRRVALTEDQRAELLAVVKRDPRPSVRERASAVLPVGDGAVAAQVAAQGWLVRRDPDTVSGWLDRYAARGVAGLTIAPGRGRKPRLSPPAG
jgi:hypothetical protein